MKRTFNNSGLGQCHILAGNLDEALIYIENNGEHFAIARGINIENESWYGASYFQSLESAFDAFFSRQKEDELENNAKEY